MTRSEVSKLLVYINALDSRVTLDDSKVIAWERVLRDWIDYESALDMVDKHYEVTKDVIMLSDINTLFASIRARTGTQEPLNAEAIIIDQTYRDLCTLDLKAKVLLDKDNEYERDGKPWRYEMGSGGYWAEFLDSGASLHDVDTVSGSPGTIVIGRDRAII